MVLFVCTLAVAVPVALVALLASIYYYLGIESLFSKQMHHAFDETVEISRLYVQEQEKHIKDDVMLLANELDIKYRELSKNVHLMEIFLDQQTNKLMLSRAVLFAKGSVMAKTLFNFSFIFEIMPQNILKNADLGIYVEKLLHRNKIRAVMRLDTAYQNINNTEVYLMVERDIEPDISQHLIDVEQSANIYKLLSFNIKKIRLRVIIAFALSTAILLIFTIIFANRLASFIVHPINRLVQATSHIRSGDYSIRVQETEGHNETTMLAKAFNNMMDTIDVQHKNLKQANIFINERRHFIETVLEELSTGVLTIGEDKRILLYNSAAVKLLRASGRLLGSAEKKLNHQLYYDAFPELDDVIHNLFNNNVTYTQNSSTKIDSELFDCNDKKSKEECIDPAMNYATYIKSYEDADTNNQHQYMQCKGIQIDVGTTQNKRQFLIQAEPIYTENGLLHNVVITFDDITELVAAQRFTAWVDIARRIAHEMKNPLTPIQLMVERLQTKFSTQIHNNRAQFDRYLETINGRVEDMRRMIHEFVEFSRLSQPCMQVNNLHNIISEAIFLQKNISPDIAYTFISDGAIDNIECDGMHMMQVFTNLLKNAGESIALKSTSGHHGANDPGSISVKTYTNPQETTVLIVVQDNGVGIQDGILGRICEPYVTTKNKGMGLGLSIVKKIIYEHGGELNVENNAEGGARVTFTLKKRHNISQQNNTSSYAT